MTVQEIEITVPATVAASKADIENETYRLYLIDTEGSSLRYVLMRHAQAVCLKVLRRVDSHLVNEAVNRVMLGIPTFKGDSLFSTWAHAIIRNVMYIQRRQDRRKKKETSVDIPGFDLPGESSTELVDMMLTIEETLEPADFEIFKLTVIQGVTDLEAAELLKIPRSTLNKRVRAILGVLKNVFGKRLSNRSRS